MTEHSLTENVLDRIKNEHIAPKPRWEFLLKNYVIWIIGGLSIIIGSISVSVMIFLAETDDWAAIMQLGGKKWIILLNAVPYFWAIFLIGFLVIARYNLLHTKRGYKITLPVFAVASVLLSVILGSLFYAMGVGTMIDNALAKNARPFLGIIHPRLHIWSNAEQGMLAGKIISQENRRTVTIRGFDENTWIVQILPPERPLPELPESMPIRFVGQRTGENTFNAIRVILWEQPKPMIPMPFRK